jgi:hypothetical protein
LPADLLKTAEVGSESATVTVGGPSFGYTSPAIWMEVFYDQIYKTFYFQPKELLEFVFKGKLTDKFGKPAKWQEITATANGKKFHNQATPQRQCRRSFAAKTLI